MNDEDTSRASIIARTESNPAHSLSFGTGSGIPEPTEDCDGGGKDARGASLDDVVVRKDTVQPDSGSGKRTQLISRNAKPAFGELPAIGRASVDTEVTVSDRKRAGPKGS